ncbi:1-deoxy-D-xylulose-5-phosphate reductoisomerase [Georgenia faecalis]|uniref:1-deoxy-D-xylulose-5-phosphate reductoisomerase n=1 Tax=Georgenia faecalis TaxID=2483799 RepID=UPI000FDC89F0|nr:1-deoxy-D-xylulose-5-phosphate reductoisomerase [Georgenia faecalis]
MSRSLAILGSTGSVGTQALDVVADADGAYEVRALAAGGGNPALLAEQVLAHDVPVVAIAGGDPGALRAALADRASDLGRPVPDVEILVGPAAAADVAGQGHDVVLNAVTGSVGLAPTLAALSAGSHLALANKESLVVGGALVHAAQRRPDQIAPVDSEHSAIAQALRSGTAEEVRRLILTASGGPFRGRTRAELADVTPEAALAHPTWAMGPVITINSATLVNKGLELIEAHLLFGVPVEDIAVVVHPQSVVHSMVEFCDGSTIAQASPPDMRLPIALGLTWPQRPQRAVAPCRWDVASAWTFEPLDEETFPAVGLARAAVTASATHPAVLNAANEECVDAFLAGRLPFLGITDVLAQVLDEHDGAAAQGLTLDDVLAAERWARTRAHELLPG